MKRKLTSQPNSEAQNSSEQKSEHLSGKEFNNVEELLRHDALHTPIPPAIVRRLNTSLRGISSPEPSWWQRLFNK